MSQRGEWTNFNGGERWRILETGEIELEKGGIVRTRGEPRTMMQLWEDAHRTIEYAACESSIDQVLLYGIAGIEMAAYKVKSPVAPGETVKTYHLDWRRLRWEKKTKARPRGEYSGSPWQLLTSTASAVNGRHQIIGEGREVLVADLWVPSTSARIAAHYLRELQDKYGSDPMLLQAAWNAGGVYKQDSRDFGMRTYGEDRPRHYAAWHNDAIAVLREMNR